MSDLNTENLIEQINAELDRLDVRASETNSSGFVVAAEDDLPAGWVRIYDDYETRYGLASDVLSTLETALDEEITDAIAFEEVPPNDHRGLLATYDALEKFDEQKPDGPTPWNDYHEFTGTEAGETGLGLIAIRTNGGIKWGFAPTDPDYSTCGTTHDFSERFDTEQEALDAALDFAACSAAEDEAEATANQ